MSSLQRPLSPHLQVYRPQITSVLSILHRITGVALGLGAVLLSFWIAAVASGPESYALAGAIAGSWPGLLIILGFSFALYYHLFNGIRHLAWDMGYGFDLKTVTITGWAVVTGAGLATLLTWWFALGLGGAS